MIANAGDSHTQLPGDALPGNRVCLWVELWQGKAFLQTLSNSGDSPWLEKKSDMSSIGCLLTKPPL